MVMLIMIIGKVCCLLIWKCNFFFITIVIFGTLIPWKNVLTKIILNSCFQFIVSCIFLLGSIAIYCNIILQMWKKNNILLPKNSESNNIAIVFWYALGGMGGRVCVCVCVWGGGGGGEGLGPWWQWRAQRFW